ncbi:MAG: SOS response-associated peptidase [Desulfarculus sp.]|nr:SOS response-associated peptidase [Desulfarculus sp.]
MCGRFTQCSELAVLEGRFDASAQGLVVHPRYNLAPTQDALVVVQAPVRNLVLMRWGLVPAWAKDPSIGHKLINARLESAADKPSFRQAFRQRRCLIPSDGFYEWRQATKSRPKVPLLFLRRDHAPFAMAGLWESWHSPAGQEMVTFTILTTEANAVVQPVHDRMPVILLPENEAPWLDPAQHDPQALAGLIRSYPAELMEAYQVSPAVNLPAHEGPELIAPVKITMANQTLL